jgi:hypothetical protein
VIFAAGLAIALGTYLGGWRRAVPPRARQSEEQFGLTRHGDRRVCLAACAAAVIYGFYLLIPQFH